MTYEQNLKAILDTHLTEIKDEIKDSIIDSILRLKITGKWIPVSDPLNELPKDRPLLVTVIGETAPGEIYRYVTELYYDYYDMTGWSDINDAKNAVAYQYCPEPYMVKSEE